MSYPIPNTIKTYALAGLFVLITWMPWGNVQSAIAENTMDTDIMMTIDTSETFDNEAQMFNNFLNVFTAAYIATEGNLEVVVLDRNSICISAHNGGCLSKATTRNRDVATEVGSMGPQMTTLSAYGQ